MVCQSLDVGVLVMSQRLPLGQIYGLLIPQWSHDSDVAIGGLVV
jgi:hypothetical protein